MPVTINGTTGIAGPDGSASTPAVQGTDSNTGLFFPAADTVAISTGGTQRITIDSSGNLGLGVTPTNVVGIRKLEIGGTTNAAVVLSTNSSNAAARNWATAANFNAFGDYVFLQSNALGGDPTTAGTARMTLDASGLLGIGTTSPAGLLDIQGTQTFSLLMTRFGSAANTALRRANGTQATPTIINNGETIHQITFQGYDGVSAYQSAARISSIIDGATISASSMPGALLFATTASGSTTVTERARITSGGVLDLATGAGAVGQIQFPATQVASSNANTLDDYEEGEANVTYSPESSGTITVDTNNDRIAYTKIGRQVTITGQVQISAVSSPAGGYVHVNGLPFASADLTEAAGRIGGAVTFYDASATSYTAKGVLMIEGDTKARLYIDASTVAASDGFIFSFSYFTT